MNVLVTVKNGKTTKREYKTQMNMHKATEKAIKEGCSFIGKKYENGETYVWNCRTKLFVEI